MEISGSAPLAVSRELAMVNKVQQATAEQGRQALQLIAQAGALPVASPAAAHPGRLNIVA
jgi:hypothetical protein